MNNHKIVRLLPVIIFLSIGLALSLWSSRGEAVMPQPFKSLMHRIFHGYNHAHISVGMQRYAVTDIHLRRTAAAMEDIPEFLPKYNMDGSLFNGKLFMSNIDKFLNKIKSFRTALKEKNMTAIEQLPGDIFNTCIKCHKEAKLKYLFKVPTDYRSLFKEYMHHLSENFHDLQILMDTSGVIHEKVDSLMLIDYYLDLLGPTLPGGGPSGVIVNRNSAIRHIQELKARTNTMRRMIIGGQPINTEEFRISLNSFCVSCHEPERIR